MLNTTPKTQTRRSIIACLVVGAIVVAALVGASLWQKSVHDSRADDAEAHAMAASLMADVDQQAASAATLLEQYVKEGDPAVVPQIEAQITTAVDTLTKALAASGDENLKELGVEGTAMGNAAAQVIVLRQSGDVAAAATMLEGLSPKFEGLKATLGGVAAGEVEKAASAGDAADSAQNRASALLLGGLVAAGVTVLALAAFIARAFARRQERASAA